MIQNKIKISNLSKKYYLGANNLISFLLGRSMKEFVALDNIELEINEGDRIGLIGKNGSGKSTLLKIISKVTLPTSGQIQINGKVSSILEAGTGFHAELSGIDNIFFYGALLGMSKNVIIDRINSIIEFAELNDFKHVPMKRYSSGMLIRLAFSISLFLDGDIIILDEVLAVADEKFRKKCTKKILEDCKKLNKTLIFVGHNEKSIQEICNKVIYLKKGKLIGYGDVDKMLNLYNEEVS